MIFLTPDVVKPHLCGYDFVSTRSLESSKQ